MRWGLLGLLLCAACQTAVTAGTPCVRNSECTAPLVCGHGRCRPACAMNRDCGPGQRCFLEQDGTGTCSLEVESGCASDPSRPCACNLSCREDQCVTPCAQLNDCAADGVCRMDATHAGTYCFATPAGLPVDLGVATDASTDVGADTATGSDAGVDASASDGGPVTGCTNSCAAIPTCATGTTIIQGTVTAPGHSPVGMWGNPDPLPNVVVFVPLVTPPAFMGGVQTVCGQPSSYAVMATTGADGSFMLMNAPSGPAVPLVMQIGRWRRQITVNVTPCTITTLTPDQGRLPRNQLEGDIPLMAMVTGNTDAMECALYKIGIDTAEFTAPAAQGGNGRVRVYVNNGATVLGPTPPSSSVLFSTPSELALYDAVLMACPGVTTAPSGSDQSNLIAYTTGGGRVFATHDNYVWLTNSPAAGPVPFSGTATWMPGQASTPTLTATIDTTFARGVLLANWLQTIGATTTMGQIPLMSVNHDFNAVTMGQGQQWLFTASQPIHYTFDTPVGAMPGMATGRVAFSDFHVESATTTMGITFPMECGMPAPLTPQERVLEYMLFDLAACVSPSASCTTPMSCASEGIQCGMAYDGCGGIQVCGGACGGALTCVNGRCQ